MKVTLIDSMGTDLSVVNAARVSFNKEATWERQIDTQGIYELADRDKKLIRYLARHGHWTPFGHCFFSFRLHIPIFVARQLVKHQVGLCLNEVSRRYIDEEPEFYVTLIWRGKSDNKKQASYDVKIYINPLTINVSLSNINPHGSGDPSQSGVCTTIIKYFLPLIHFL